MLRSVTVSYDASVNTAITLASRPTSLSLVLSLTINLLILFYLQGALGSLCWRTAPLAAELLKRLEAANFTHHPYQNVRETVGRLVKCNHVKYGTLLTRVYSAVTWLPYLLKICGVLQHRMLVRHWVLDGFYASHTIQHITVFN